MNQQPFFWGAASAAYQVEGAYRDDGKGLGIWDALSEGHVVHGDNGNVACDHYHRYKEDVAIMKELGLKAYRFSISWPRVMPEEGKINEAGLEFYKNLVAELKAAEIEPMCTIYHWNLPMWLHEKGGWRWDGISDAFAEYTKVLADALSGDIRYWMTINEPACFGALGYLVGVHAPFESCMGEPEKLKETEETVSRNILLAHGKAVQTLRKYGKQPLKIGVALNANLIEPFTEEPDEIERARAATFSDADQLFSYSWWADPMFLGKVPEWRNKYLSDEELAIIHQPLDFLGFNSYSDGNYDEHMGPNPNVIPGMPRTAMGWPITPNVLYWSVRFLYDRYQVPILVTENGMANLDFVMSDGKVHDPQRIEFLKGYLAGVERAREEGYPLLGYLYWSILDNFEWAEGYDKRFGLVHVDYPTGTRTLKDSAYWYKEYIANHE